MFLIFNEDRRSLWHILYIMVFTILEMKLQDIGPLWPIFDNEAHSAKIILITSFVTKNGVREIEARMFTFIL